MPKSPSHGPFGTRQSAGGRGELACARRSPKQGSAPLTLVKVAAFAQGGRRRKDAMVSDPQPTWAWGWKVGPGCLFEEGLGGAGSWVRADEAQARVEGRTGAMAGSFIVLSLKARPKRHRKYNSGRSDLALPHHAWLGCGMRLRDGRQSLANEKIH